MWSGSHRIGTPSAERNTLLSDRISIPMNSPKYSQDPLQSGGGESRSTIGQTARATASKVGTAASEAASKVKDSAEKMAAERKDMAADRVGAYGSAIHDTAKSLEEQDPNIAWLTHRAADKLESVATYVRTRDFHGLREDAASLARRHPAAFFGGMCVAGLVLGSVIRAARQSTRSSSPDESGNYKDSGTGYPNYTTGENSGSAGSMSDRPESVGASAQL